MFKRTILQIIFILSIFIITTGCNQNPFFGVGNEVDVVKPSIDITSHTNGQWVNYRFTLAGKASDNLGVDTVSIRWIIKDGDGNEQIKNEWNASLSGEGWSKKFSLSDDFNNQTGYKTLDIYAFDKRGNAANTRILIGLSTEMSVTTLTSPREEILPEDPGFYDADPDFWNNFENVAYFLNNDIYFTGYTKTQYLPDSSVTFRLYASDDLENPVYQYTITDGETPETGKAEGNTVNWTFIVDSTEYDDGAYFVEVVPTDVAGIEWPQNKRYIYINQDTDNPRTTISSPGDSTFPESIAGGKTFDDDGIDYIYWIIYKNSGSDPVPVAEVGRDIWDVWQDFSDLHSDGGNNVLTGMIDVSDKKPLLYPWNVTTPKADGQFTLEVLSIDIYGTVGDLVSHDYEQISSEQPSIQITDPDATQTYSGSFDVTVRAVGGGSNKVKTIFYDIYSSVHHIDNGVLHSGTDFAFTSPVDVSFSVDSTLFTTSLEHDIKVTVWCENENSNTSNVPFRYLKADNAEPSSEIFSPDLRASGFSSSLDPNDQDDIQYYKNQTITIKGMITDDFLASSVQLMIVEDGTTEYDFGTVNTGGPWEFDVDTTSLNDDKEYLIRIISTDSAGNSRTQDLGYIYVDQDMDKPNAKVLSPASGDRTFPEATVNGVAWDDDGLGSLYWYIGNDVPPVDYTTWNSVVETAGHKGGMFDLSSTNPTLYSWNVTTPSGEGNDYKIYLRPVDKNGVAALTNIELAYEQYNSTVPVINITNLDTMTTYNGTETVNLNGTGGGSYTVDEVYYKVSSDKLVGSFVQLLPFTSGASVTPSFDIDTSLYTDAATHDITVEVYCVNSNSEESLHTFSYIKADNEDPSAEIFTPELRTAGFSGSLDPANQDDIQYYKNQNLIISGTISDDLRASSVELILVEDGITEHSQGTVITGGPWSFTVDTTSLTDEKEYMVRLVIDDAAGNSVTTGFNYIYVDQDMDIPQASVSSPASGSITFPGATANGLAWDDDGLDFVYWYVGNDAPPALYTDWASVTETADHKGGRFDLSATNPTMYSWNITTPTGEGAYTIYLRPVDENGLADSLNTTLSFEQYASTKPVINITNLDPSSTYTDVITVDLNGTGGGAYDVDEVYYKVSSSLDAGSFTELLPFTAGATVTPSFTIDTSAFTDAAVHDITVEVYCVNSNAEESDHTFSNIKADNTAATINISTPLGGAGLNGTAAVTGSWSDDWSGVKSIYIGYFASMDNATMDASYTTEAQLDTDTTVSPTLGNWVKVSGPSTAWSYDFDTTEITATQANPYNIYVAAVDNVGNVSYTSKAVYIDQDLDKPTSEILVPEAASVTFPSSKVSGSSTDDDGLSYVYWFVGKTSVDFGSGLGNAPVYSTWDTYDTADAKGGVFDLTATEPKSHNWQFNTPSGSGEYKVYILSFDDDGTQQDSNTTVTYQQFSSTQPVIQIDSPDPGVTHNGDITVEMSASGGGSFTVDEIHYTVSSTKPHSISGTLTPGAGYTAGSTVSDASFTFDSSLFVTSAIHDVKVEVYCVNSEAVDSQTMTIYYRADNTKPTLTIESPGTNANINGDSQYISGTSSDWSGVKALYISYYQNCPIGSYTTESLLETDTRVTPTQNYWYKIDSPSSNWSHTFDTTVVEPSSTGIIDPYNFYVVAVDYVGNLQTANISYTLNQDLDRPTVNITQPSYSSVSDPWESTDSMSKFGTSFLLTGTSSDDDGVASVEIDVDLMDFDGTSHTKNTDVYPATAASFDSVTGTVFWSQQLESLAVCTTSQYYRITPRVTDINGRTEEGSPSYFIVSDQTPMIEIIWPSTIDPDMDQRYNSDSFSMEDVSDSFGTIISNRKDDMYWDNNLKNNHIYLPDSPKFFFGWENSVANDTDSSPQNGIPDVYDNAAGDSFYRDITEYTSDFDESVLGIFDEEVGADTGRSNYFRMMFRAKDPNTGGEIRKIEVSYNGGSIYETAFVWNGTYLESQNTSKYAYNDADSNNIPDEDAEGYGVFYINLDTTSLSSSQIIKIKVTDNNVPAYFSIANVQVTPDNVVPTGSMIAWGTNDPLNKTNLSSTNSYLGGNADDDASGVRNVVVYLWNNQGTPESPVFGGTGSLTASGINVPTGPHTVSVADFVDIDPAVSDQIPDYWLKANMYTPTNWRITDVYQDIFDKYGSYPVDGLKLAYIRVTDNAGNMSDYSGSLNNFFYELTFSEFPPALSDLEMTWTSTHGSVATTEILTDETTAGRIWVSGDLEMAGETADDIAGDPDPGVNRVRVYLKSNDGVTTHATWSTEADGSVEITGGTGNGVGPFSWTMSARDLSAYTGNYLLEVEVRDKVGVTTTQTQYIFIDNIQPSLTVSKPTAGMKVTGDFKIYGTASDAGGFDTDSILIEILNGGTPTGTEWNVTPDGSNDWEQWWNTSLPLIYDGVRVTFTDKAKNEIVETISIIKDPSPPDYDSFSVTDTDGAASLIDSSIIAGHYSAVQDSQFYIVRGNVTVANQISDDEEITDSGAYLSGAMQSDGSTIAETFTAFTPNSDNTSLYQVGQGTTYPYNALSAGEYRYRAWIEQQAGAIEVNLNKYFIIDNEKPHIWIETMSNTDYVTTGSGFSEVKHGHIDTGLVSNGAADDASGVIFVDLKAFDNYLIDNIQVRLTDYDFGLGDGNWVTIAQRTIPGDGSWIPSGNGALGDLDYWNAAITDQSLAENEDRISLRLEFNTANLTNVAGIAKNLEFRVFDAAGHESDGAGVSTEQGADPSVSYSAPDSNFQRIAQKPLDIVPYITDVSRSVDTNRTKYGKYPVVLAETGITISGYNLAETGTNWVRVYNTAGTANDTVTVTASASPYDEITVSLAAVTHSGHLRLLVNNVEATNNINDNGAVNDVNKENSMLIQGSDLWTDDRYLQVWEDEGAFGGGLSVNPIHPAMERNGNTLYASWTDYGTSSLFYGTLTNRWTAFGTYDPPEWTDLVVDSSGVLHIVDLDNRYNGGTAWGQLETCEANSGAETWASIESLGDDSATSPNHADRRDEMMYQFQNPRIALDSTDRNYVSYYDSYSKSLKYAVTDGTNRVQTIWDGSGNSGVGDCVVAGDDLNDTPDYADEDAGLWSDIQVDGTIPVIAYYSVTDRTLKIARGTEATPDNQTEWTYTNVQPSNSYIGYYVSMKIDSNSDLHIATYKTSTGDLMYYFGDWNGTTYSFTETVIDSNGAVGSWCDLTLEGVVPMISYLDTSMVGTFYGLKYAYYDTGLGEWEYGTVALDNSVNNKRSSIVSSGTWGDVAIGYASEDYRATSLKSEE